MVQLEKKGQIAINILEDLNLLVLIIYSIVVKIKEF